MEEHLVLPWWHLHVSLPNDAKSLILAPLLRYVCPVTTCVILMGVTGTANVTSLFCIMASGSTVEAKHYMDYGNYLDYGNCFDYMPNFVLN